MWQAYDKLADPRNGQPDIKVSVSDPSKPTEGAALGGGSLKGTYRSACRRIEWAIEKLDQANEKWSEFFGVVDAPEPPLIALDEREITKKERDEAHAMRRKRRAMNGYRVA